VEETLQFKNLHKARKPSEEHSKEDIKNSSLHLKENLEERHLQGGHQNKGMKIFFMVTASHVMNMVTKICIADIMQGNMLEDSIKS
jgi:ribosomal protein L9